MGNRSVYHRREELIDQKRWQKRKTRRKRKLKKPVEEIREDSTIKRCKRAEQL